MNETVQRWLPRAPHYGITWFLRRRGLHYGIRRALCRTDSLYVSRSSKLVIEGLPGLPHNTTVHGVIRLQDQAVAVAHHKHHAAQMAVTTGRLLRAGKSVPCSWHALPNKSRLSIKNDLCGRLKVEFRLGRLHNVLTRCGEIHEELAASR